MFDCGPLLYTSIASNTCGLWILVCVQASSPSQSFKSWIGYYVCVQASFSGPLWSYTFGLVKPCCAQASVSTRASNTFCGSWSVHIIGLQLFVSNTFDSGILFVYPPAHTKLRVAEKILHRARAPKPLSIFFEKEPLFENWFDFDDGEHLVDQTFQ